MTEFVRLYVKAAGIWLAVLFVAFCLGCSVLRPTCTGNLWTTGDCR